MILDEKERERRKEKEEVGARVSDRLKKTGVCRGVRERECETDKR